MHDDNTMISGIDGVCTVTRAGGPDGDPDAAPDLLIEVPHGATRLAHYALLRERLVSDLPDDLRDFFLVNTDVGAPECAEEIARRLTDPVLGHARRQVLVVRSLVPRIFIDCNRAVDLDHDAFKKAGFTPVVPPYVTSPDDVALLESLHRSYHEVVERAYRRVCGSGGLALILHTYAPKSVGIDTVDENIVAALREAYRPEVYAEWPARPDVDLITETDGGQRLAQAELVDAVGRAYAAIGIDTVENGTYRLHPATMGHRYSERYPQQVLCVEISRALLADPFSPFEEMRIGAQKVARMAAPLATALHERLG